jgi:uncharacterized membrane protein (DUF2068 family)
MKAMAKRGGSKQGSSKPGGSKQGKDLWIILIGIFKLVKGTALLILGIGLLRLLHRDVAAVATHWIERFRMDPDNQHIHRVLERIFRVTPKQLKELSAGTFIYAGVFLTEGTGLLLRKHWAEYLTVVSTALFIPLEVYEVWHRFTWVRVAVLAANVATVWYLALRIRRRRF